MHYTTAAGLAGIVSSSSVWASHAAFLNDAEEMKHFFDVRLFDIAFAEALEYANEVAHSPDAAKEMEADGGIVEIARKEAAALTAQLRSSILSFNHPYIFSMSAAHDPRVSRSGLLSQWRGYGADGGYALVFDTVGFDNLLQLEGHAFLYQHAQWGDVHYHGINIQPSIEDVAEAEAVVRIGLARMIRGRTAAELPEDFYEKISSLSCLYKHWGFSEEHEVRVIAIPFRDEIAAQARAEGEAKLPRQPKTFLRSGIPVPYLELFAQLPGTPPRLPIKRVIVGPHREKTLRAEAVRVLLAANGYAAEVVCSETPYIGR